MCHLIPAKDCCATPLLRLQWGLCAVIGQTGVASFPPFLNSGLSLILIGYCLPIYVYFCYTHDVNLMWVNTCSKERVFWFISCCWQVSNVLESYPEYDVVLFCYTIPKCIREWSLLVFPYSFCNQWYRGRIPLLRNQSRQFQRSCRSKSTDLGG